MQNIDRAIEKLLCSTGDPLDELRHIGPGHGEGNIAAILRAAAGVIAKVPSALPSIRRALFQFDRTAAPPAAIAHAEAAESWVGGDPVGAARQYAAIVAGSPQDLLALRLLQSCYFFLGWHQQLVTVCDAVLRNWSGDTEGLQFALAMTSFAHAEAGDTVYAEQLGRKAMALNRACPTSVHSVAHAYAESGQHRAGAEWMRQQLANWCTESRMRTHNAWHLAMFDLEAGNSGSALQILDRWLLPEGDRSELDACDAATLLGGLGLERTEASARWRRVSDAFERSTPCFWSYIDLHAGLAHLLAHQPRRARRLGAKVEICARRCDHAALRARRITLPWLEIFAAIADGRTGAAITGLERAQPLLAEAGGSKAQLEIFHRIVNRLTQSKYTRPLQESRDEGGTFAAGPEPSSPLPGTV